MAEALANPVAPVEYPESDDTPVESMKQWNVVAQVVMALRRFLGRRALVAANMGVYYRRGDPSGLIVPDLFVAMGTPKIEEPDVYLTWEQGKPPDLAMEVASKNHLSARPPREDRHLPPPWRQGVLPARSDRPVPEAEAARISHDRPVR